MTPDLSSLVAALPVKWQNKAKAVASAVVVLLGSVLPIVSAAGVALPAALVVTVPLVLALLLPLTVYAVPNAPTEPTD